jgi:hypothetical protein
MCIAIFVLIYVVRFGWLLIQNAKYVWIYTAKLHVPGMFKCPFMSGTLNSCIMHGFTPLVRGDTRLTEEP